MKTVLLHAFTNSNLAKRGQLYTRLPISLRALIFIAIIFLRFTADAQLKIFSMDLPLNIKNLEAMAVGDSILLSFREGTNNVYNRKTRWIYQSKAVTTVISEDPIAVIPNDGRYYMYYLAKNSKNISINALVVGAQEKSTLVVNMQVPVRGTVVGFYVDRGLHMILLDDQGKQLTLLTIDKTKVIKEVKCDLPDNVTLKNKSIDFYTPGSRVNSFRGFSNVHAFIENGFLLITAEDEPEVVRSSSTGELKETKSRGTDVITIALLTGEVDIATFPPGQDKTFGSFIIDDKLFRMMPTPESFGIKVYDLKTKNLLHADSITIPVEYFYCHFRYGGKNIVGHRAPFLQVMRESGNSRPVIFVEKAGDKYVVQYGTYYGKANLEMATSHYAPVRIASIVGPSILQLQEAPGVHRYFSYQYNPSSGFERKDSDPPTLRDKIDNFENTNIPRVANKTYFDYKNGVAGVYHDDVAKILYIIYYE